MRLVKFHSWLLTAAFCVGGACAGAQLSGQPVDPLARIRDAAKSNVQACSATGETLCEQVAPKIIANAQGESPLAENLRRLDDEVFAETNAASAPARASAWAVAAFREAGVEGHKEGYGARISGPQDRENIVAEIRGREKPDEWVLIAAHLDTFSHSLNNCDAAGLIEAARDIQRTGIHPRRSLRFVLFTGDAIDTAGSWAYVRAHRGELDHVSAVVVFNSGCHRINGYSVNGRHDLEPGLREAMKPIESFGANRYTYDANEQIDGFDFLIEGVPTLTITKAPVSAVSDSPQSDSPQSGVRTHATVDVSEIKRNTAVVAVTAFGIAERAAPLGSRQSRSKIESLLKETGLEQTMKRTNLWRLWQSGQRGRLP